MSKLISFVILLAGAVVTGCGAYDGSGDVGGSTDESSASNADVEQNNEPVASVGQAIMYPKFVATCSSSGQQQASCDAYCPNGYMATGGGCKTSTIFWDISESNPIVGVEGWHCQANEDFGSKAFWNSVTGYAVCIQF